MEDIEKLVKKIHRDHINGKKVEATECTDASSSGSVEGAVSFGSTNVVKRKKIYEPNNTKKYNVNETEEEFTEAMDASASGSFDVPLFGKTTKGRKDPLAINGEKSIKTSRAVTDKKFPKWGGPSSIFVKVKDKCKKFPYCNQGIGALELYEIDELNESVAEISKEMGIPRKELEKIVLNEINKIFI